MSAHLSKFDIDLQYGQEGESLVESFLRGNGKYEVKRDWEVSRTGNVAVEVGKKVRDGEADSGLSATEADWWVFVLGGDYYVDEVVIFIKTSRLRGIVSQVTKRDGFIWGGDNKKSKLVLIPVKLLLE